MTSPRNRRLVADHLAVRQLVQQSELLDMSCSGDPPSTYLLRFQGHGLSLDAKGDLHEQWVHEVRVHLGANYPRMMPELHWLTPIFHPNISANGLVCLGGYSTHWVPSLRLDDLCLMLWDMIRYRNFDISSPYNRVAAEWAKTQRHFILPLDPRSLRAATGPKAAAAGASPCPIGAAPGGAATPQGANQAGPIGSDQPSVATSSNAEAATPMPEITFL